MVLIFDTPKWQVYQGSTHITATRGFVEFMFTNPVAIEFKKWLKYSGIPDETFSVTLNYNPHLGAPGAYIGKLKALHNEDFITRNKMWFDCRGRVSKYICIVNTGRP